MNAVPKNEAKDRLRRNEEKWTPELMAAGWTVIPSVILERQQALGLDPTDMNIILQLARYWWFSDNPPRPSKKAIAECIGIDASTVRRRIQRMETDGILRRVKRSGSDGRQDANAYLFDGLINAAKPYAREAVAQQEKRRTEDGERRRRRRLVLVSKG